MRLLCRSIASLENEGVDEEKEKTSNVQKVKEEKESERKKENAGRLAKE